MTDGIPPDATATWSGVSPPLSLCALTTAPCSASTLTHCAMFCTACSVMDGREGSPRASASPAAAAATWRGVSPHTFRALASAPRSKSV